jgi:hypothetical protein
MIESVLDRHVEEDGEEDCADLTRIGAMDFDPRVGGMTTHSAPRRYGSSFTETVPKIISGTFQSAAQNKTGI